MTDRTVSVSLRANVTDYMAKFAAAGKATSEFATKVETARGKSKAAYQELGRAALLTGGAVVAGFVVAGHEMATFEAKMALVRTLSHSTAGDMSKLKDAALHVGQAYGFSATQVADAEAELVKAGISVKDILGGALTGALTLAAAGQTDVAAATETAAIAMTQFKLTGKDVPHIADLLAAGADKALGSVADLSMGLQSGGLVASQFGLTIDETVGTLSAFAQSGLLAEKGGTVLRQMFLKLAAPSQAAQGWLQKLGITLYDSQGKFVGVTKLAGELHDKMAPLADATRNTALATIFGSRAIQGANVLYAQGAVGIQGWIDRVNASGFAALQAAGKMDSLSGDVTKFKSALQAAFIGVGESENGPLRSVVQDATGMLTTFNKLPAPVKTTGEALVAVGGAITLVGGAAILAVPKVAALDLALKGMSGGAVTARGSLLALSKGGLVLGGLIAISAGVSELQHVIQGAPPDVDKLSRSLTDLAATGAATGELTKAFGPGLKDLGKEIRALADPSINHRIQDVLSTVFTFGHDDSKLKEAKDDLHAVDDALAGLVTGGHLDAAQQAWSKLSAAAKVQGISVSTLAGLLPNYGQALNDSAASAKGAADGTDQFGNKVSDLRSPLEQLTQSAKDYDDALHALADPLFAMNKALQDLATAHDNAGKAVKKYGATSKQARQANLDLASSALDVEAAATTLAAAVQGGTVSLGGAKHQLREWVAQGLITKAQADDIATSFQHIIDKAVVLGGKHITVTVDAATTAAESALRRVKQWLDQIHDKNIDVTVRQNMVTSGPGHSTQQPNRAGGGAVRGPGSGTSDSIVANLSNGEFVVRADGSNLGDALRHFGTPGFAAGGLVGDVVRAVLTDTLPKSLDKLSLALRDAITHLGNIVSAAQSYRASAVTSLTSYADASGAVNSGVSTVTYKRAKANDLKRFAQLYRKLEDKHLDAQTLGEFFAAGPAAIPAMQDLLRPGAVREVNRIDRQERRTVSGLATAGMNDQYGPRVARALEGLPASLSKAVAKALHGMEFRVSADGKKATVSQRRRTG